MAQTCQHCGTVTDNDSRVMCPSCGRRIAPAGAATSPPPPTNAAAAPPPVEPPPSAAPPPSPYAPSPYAPPPPTAGAAPAYAPYATAESTWPSQVGPPGVDVDYRRGVIAQTSRLTVAFRVILALPHLIVLWALGYAVIVVTIVAWFAALFTARVPEGIYGFIGWIVRYGTRVVSYLWLLTDRWPAFTENADDEVQVRLPGPQRLNRAAVFFRLILMIPAAILASVLNSGLAIAGFFIWLIVLIRGRVPQPVFDGAASAVRFQTRFYAYVSLLTARYPSGVYGDPGEATDASATTDAPVPPIVNQGAKRMVVLFVVLGVLGVIGQVVASAANTHTATPGDTRPADSCVSVVGTVRCGAYLIN